MYVDGQYTYLCQYFQLRRTVALLNKPLLLLSSQVSSPDAQRLMV